MASEQPIRVLFVCTGNAARSQVAEAMLRHLGGSRFLVRSAGTRPRPDIHPLVPVVLAEIGIPSDGLYPKDLSSFEGEAFDYVISLCDRASQECASFTGAEVAHWSFPDPVEGDESGRAERFRALTTGLERRIRLLMIVEKGDGT